LILFALGKKAVMPVRVLVVDDDALSREVLALLLHAAGYAVETADSGDAALLHLQTARPLPQVVLADLQMPGTSGKELARQLRGLCGSGTTLMAMSGSSPDDQSDREFDGFLLKPFTMEAFAAAIGGKTPEAEKGSGGATADALDEAVYRKLAGSMRRPQLEQLYALCLADTEGRLVGMRQAASNRDDAAYRREAHAIKGGCGMVGALELQTLATSMEKRGLSDDHVASLNEFIVACERLRRILVALEIIHDRASGVSGEDA
jgi:CheY-like chemotaxis protein/HPt (histidine-containing phosphotransfer) domain-containing protein